MYLTYRAGDDLSDLPDAAPVVPASKYHFDASDISTLWQDTAGTSQVDTLGQDIRRMSDLVTSGTSYLIDNVNYPTYASTSYGPAADFTAVKRLEDSDTTMTLPTGTADRTLVAVVSTVTSTGGNYDHLYHYGSGGVADAAYGLMTRANGISEWGNHFWAGSNNWASGIASIQTPPQLAIVWFTDSDKKDRLQVNNGTVAESAALTISTGSASPFTIGSRLSGPTEGGAFMYHEGLMYDRLLTADERTTIFDVMVPKWGIV
jgi:hypothetical protein